MNRTITPEEFAEKYKETITDDLNEVIANLEKLAAAHKDLAKNLYSTTTKLKNALSILCDVPPPCSIHKKS